MAKNHKKIPFSDLRNSSKMSDNLRINTNHIFQKYDYHKILKNKFQKYMMQ